MNSFKKTDDYTQRGSCVFLRVSYVRLQEAVLYLGRPRGPQQGVSLAALLQPVLLWEGFSRVLRHGVGLLLQSQRAESRTTKLQTFTHEHPVTYESQKDTSPAGLLMSLCSAYLPFFFLFLSSIQSTQLFKKSFWSCVSSRGSF